MDGWPETGFLREYFVTGEEIGKNPVSLIVDGGQKPGFCDRLRYSPQIREKPGFFGS